ncbi:hypothetical protein [Amycolatopsis japonica]
MFLTDSPALDALDGREVTVVPFRLGELVVHASVFEFTPEVVARRPEIAALLAPGAVASRFNGYGRVRSASVERGAKRPRGRVAWRGWPWLPALNPFLLMVHATPGGQMCLVVDGVPQPVTEQALGSWLRELPELSVSTRPVEDPLVIVTCNKDEVRQQLADQLGRLVWFPHGDMKVHNGLLDPADRASGVTWVSLRPGRDGRGGKFGSSWPQGEAGVRVRWAYRSRFGSDPGRWLLERSALSGFPAPDGLSPQVFGGGRVRGLSYFDRRDRESRAAALDAPIVGSSHVVWTPNDAYRPGVSAESGVVARPWHSRDLGVLPFDLENVVVVVGYFAGGRFAVYDERRDVSYWEKPREFGWRLRKDLAGLGGTARVLLLTDFDAVPDRAREEVAQGLGGGELITVNAPSTLFLDHDTGGVPSARIALLPGEPTAVAPEWTSTTTGISRRLSPEPGVQLVEKAPRPGGFGSAAAWTGLSQPAPVAWEKMTARTAEALRARARKVVAMFMRPPAFLEQATEAQQRLWTVHGAVVDRVAFRIHQTDLGLLPLERNTPEDLARALVAYLGLPRVRGLAGGAPPAQPAPADPAQPGPSRDPDLLKQRLVSWRKPMYGYQTLKAFIEGDPDLKAAFPLTKWGRNNKFTNRKTKEAVDEWIRGLEGELKAPAVATLSGGLVTRHTVSGVWKASKKPKPAPPPEVAPDLIARVVAYRKGLNGFQTLEDYITGDKELKDAFPLEKTPQHEFKNLATKEAIHKWILEFRGKKHANGRRIVQKDVEAWSGNKLVGVRVVGRLWAAASAPEPKNVQVTPEQVARVVAYRKGLYGFQTLEDYITGDKELSAAFPLERNARREFFDVDTKEALDKWIRGLQNEENPETGDKFKPPEVAKLSGGLVTRYTVWNLWKTTRAVNPKSKPTPEQIAMVVGWRKGMYGRKTLKELIVKDEKLRVAFPLDKYDGGGFVDLDTKEATDEWVRGLRGEENPEAKGEFNPFQVKKLSGLIISRRAVSKLWDNASVPKPKPKSKAAPELVAKVVGWRKDMYGCKTLKELIVKDDGLRAAFPLDKNANTALVNADTLDVVAEWILGLQDEEDPETKRTISQDAVVNLSGELFSTAFVADLWADASASKPEATPEQVAKVVGWRKDMYGCKTLKELIVKDDGLRAAFPLGKNAKNALADPDTVEVVRKWILGLQYAEDPETESTIIRDTVVEWSGDLFSSTHVSDVWRAASASKPKPTPAQIARLVGWRKGDYGYDTLSDLITKDKELSSVFSVAKYENGRIINVETKKAVQEWVFGLQDEENKTRTRISDKKIEEWSGKVLSENAVAKLRRKAAGRVRAREGSGDRGVSVGRAHKRLKSWSGAAVEGVAQSVMAAGLGLRLVDVATDGDCFYAAVLRTVPRSVWEPQLKSLGQEPSLEGLRRAVAFAYRQRRPYDAVFPVVDGGIEDKIRKRGHWDSESGDIAVQLVPDVLEVNLKTITRDGEVSSNGVAEHDDRSTYYLAYNSVNHYLATERLDQAADQDSHAPSPPARGGTTGVDLPMRGIDPESSLSPAARSATGTPQSASVGQELEISDSELSEVESSEFSELEISDSELSEVESSEFSELEISDSELSELESSELSELDSSELESSDSEGSDSESESVSAAEDPWKRIVSLVPSKAGFATLRAALEDALGRAVAPEDPFVRDLVGKWALRMLDTTSFTPAGVAGRSGGLILAHEVVTLYNTTHAAGFGDTGTIHWENQAYKRVTWPASGNSARPAVVDKRLRPVVGMDGQFTWRDPEDPLFRVHSLFAGEDGEVHPALVARADEITARVGEGKDFFKQISHEKRDRRLPFMTDAQLRAHWTAIGGKAAVRMRNLVRTARNPARGAVRLAPLHPTPGQRVYVTKVKRKHVPSQEGVLVGSYQLCLADPPGSSPRGEWPAFTNDEFIDFYLGVLTGHKQEGNYVMAAGRGAAFTVIDAERAANSTAFANSALTPDQELDDTRINAAFIGVTFTFPDITKPSGTFKVSTTILVALDNAFDPITNPFGILLPTYGSSAYKF